MEATKKVTGKSVKKWLGNNAIIVLMLAVSLIVGIIHPNFFALANIINLFKNVSIRYIIALGISGCLITTGNDLSAGRLAGFAACLACIFAQTEGASGKFYPNMHTLPTPVVFILVIAICAIVLLALSAVSLVKGLIAGVSFMQITTSLNLGHVLCFICVLAGVRFFVMGDKNADYNAPQKARKRTQLVGVLFILGFICLLAAIFAELPVVLTVQAVVVFALALVLILAWKLSGKI